MVVLQSWRSLGVCAAPLESHQCDSLAGDGDADSSRDAFPRTDQVQIMLLCHGVHTVITDGATSWPSRQQCHASCTTGIMSLRSSACRC